MKSIDSKDIIFRKNEVEIISNIPLREKLEIVVQKNGKEVKNFKIKRKILSQILLFDYNLDDSLFVMINGRFYYREGNKLEYIYIEGSNLHVLFYEKSHVKFVKDDENYLYSNKKNWKFDLGSLKEGIYGIKIYDKQSNSFENLNYREIISMGFSEKMQYILYTKSGYLNLKIVKRPVLDVILNNIRRKLK